VIARKSGARVRLYSRPGNDLTHRFPLIVETLARLRSRSCIIDGEAVACDDNGVTSFNRVRYLLTCVTRASCGRSRLLGGRICLGLLERDGGAPFRGMNSAQRNWRFAASLNVASYARRSRAS
jgi:ATP dependent DNA ligase domain